MDSDWRVELLDESQDDDSALKNARWLAAQCRAENEEVMPLAAEVAQALADAAGMQIEVYGLSSGALAEVIDHLADRYEHEHQEVA